jgi:RecA/RadA recombinase
MERVRPQVPTKTPKTPKVTRVTVDDAKKMLLEEDRGLKDYFSKRIEFLHSGCSILHLPICGKIRDGGVPRARVVNIVGDGSSGKTLLALEILARTFYTLHRQKSTIYPGKRKLTMLYYNKEGVMDFKVEVMYGEKFFNAIEWVPVNTVEQFGADLFSRIKTAKKDETVIAVVDSWDALDSDADAAKFDKEIEKIIAGKTPKKKKDEEKEEKSKGSYELGKQAYASKRFFKKVCNDIHQAGIDFTLIIISQVRKRIGITFGESQYRAGGDALNFYTHFVMWLSQYSKMKMTRGREIVYGTRVRAKVKRSKVWKPYREIEFRIIFDHGIDEVGSTFDFVFGPQRGTITWKGQDWKREDALDYFRMNPEPYEELLDEAQRVWDKAEDAVAEATMPPPKYADPWRTDKDGPI